jgi:hypothetical protein
MAHDDDTPQDEPRRLTGQEAFEERRKALYEKAKEKAREHRKAVYAKIKAKRKEKAKEAKASAKAKAREEKQAAVAERDKALMEALMPAAKLSHLRLVKDE